MSLDILGTTCDQCRSMVQYSFTSTETRSLVRTDSPGRPPRLSHSSWTMTSRWSVPWRCQHARPNKKHAHTHARTHAPTHPPTQTHTHARTHHRNIPTQAAWTGRSKDRQSGWKLAPLISSTSAWASVNLRHSLGRLPWLSNDTASFPLHLAMSTLA